ncbi:MAG: hypothetical protein AAB556_00085 [Patescibacteria group bacterium]
MADEIKPIPKLRTFEADIEKFGSVKPPYKENEPIPARRIIFITVLCLIGFIGVYSFIKLISKSPEKELPSPAVSGIAEAFIKSDAESKLNFSPLDSGSLVRAVNAEKSAGRKIGTIAFLPLQLTLREFSEFIEINIPESILENASPGFNIFAVYGTKNSDLAFIIKTRNFSKAYSSMLIWEKTMWASFKPFLNAEDLGNISQYSFSDEIVRNHDARALKNSENNSILAYAMFDKQYVVIATSREALSTILQRLIASPPK